MEIQELVQKQQAYFSSNVTKSYDFRIKALNKLKMAIKDHEKDICDALYTDLNKSEQESYMSEISVLYLEINYFIKHLKHLMKPIKVRSGISAFPASSYKYVEPLGCILVIAPWNYPFHLSILPLIDCIAAGNCVSIKPSENAPATANIIKSIIDNTFDNEYVNVFLGGREKNQALLDLRWNHIIFTGGETVGRIVLEKASKYLTPVTLELGGKSPVIIDSSADLKLAAKKIVFGKFLNAGQTCIAPDYIICDASVKDHLMTNLSECITAFYQGDALECEYYPKIVNKHNLERLKSYLEGQHIVFGGSSNETKMAPTILDDVFGNEAIMQDEIFGPILPIMTYNNVNEAFTYIKNHEKPLALYLFSTNQAMIDRVISDLSFGGGCINDTIIHITNHNLPFGGVGNSGMGAYHGSKGFFTFSHQKGIIKGKKGFDFSFKYPPFNSRKLAMLKSVIK